jgi:hypothetical protein
LTQGSIVTTLPATYEKREAVKEVMESIIAGVDSVRMAGMGVHDVLF